MTYETAQMFKNSSTKNNNILKKQMISELPSKVQKWLIHSGTIGKESICNVHLKQNLQMLMNPDQKDWSFAKAEQFFTIVPPAFIWSVGLKVNPFTTVVGKDKFENGRGEMTIKMFSVFQIANAKNNEKVNKATLQRYLAEIVWFPSADLSPYIVWKKIDDTAAKATLSHNGTKGS
ncbi:MAG: hypothetical protein ACI9AV_001076 [Sediminicola sp.]